MASPSTAIEELVRASMHPTGLLNNLALLLHATNRLAEAEPLMRRALEIFEASLGPEHPNTQTAAENLRLLLAEIKKRK